MIVKIINYTPLVICSIAIRTCWQSFDKSDNGGSKDKELIDRVGNKYKHESVKNHISYVFDIKGISTKTLMALSRHNVGITLSVKSTRYTCKKGLKKEEEFKEDVSSFKRASKYVTFTGDKEVDDTLIKQLELSRLLLKKGKGCDEVSMTFTQSHKYDLIATFSMQALQHFIELRSDKSAHWDIRKLAICLFNEIPNEHKYLFKNYIKEK